MAYENRHMNQMAIEWLDVRPDDDVLEIGFGPGHGLELLLTSTRAQTVSGIDPSLEMAEQALSRNRAAAETGRLRLVAGTVESLPFADGKFSRVVAVSNFHVWASRSAGLREIHRVLRTGGKLVICLRRASENPWPWSSPGLSLSTLREDQSLLESRGFRDVQFATRKHRRRSTCLVATR
jgi:ubiquinone/menaquinone biosynthesis C-methylase UbiE